MCIESHECLDSYLIFLIFNTMCVLYLNFICTFHKLNTLNVNAVELNAWCALLLVRVSKNIRCKLGQCCKIKYTEWRFFLFNYLNLYRDLLRCFYSLDINFISNVSLKHEKDHRNTFILNKSLKLYNSVD